MSSDVGSPPARRHVSGGTRSTDEANSARRATIVPDVADSVFEVSGDPEALSDEFFDTLAGLLLKLVADPKSEPVAVEESHEQRKAV
jgi:hypothetical protein